MGGRNGARPRNKNFDTTLATPLTAPKKYEHSLQEKLQDEEVLAKIETLAGYGMNETEICYILSIPYSNYTILKQRNAELHEVWERGKAKAAAAVAKSLFKKCLDGDMSAIKWYESTRCRRSETVTVGVVHADIESLSPEVRKTRIQELQQKLALIPRVE